MKNPLFPFILMGIIIAVIGGIIWTEVNKTSVENIIQSASIQETYPSVLCISGTTIIVQGETRNTLNAWERKKITPGDTVKTLTSESSATIFWSEGSVTRLAGKTSLEINSTGDSKKREVDFSLLNGKTYSRIFEALQDKEFFQERFDDNKRVASVRGTAFEVNAEKWYVKSVNHAIEVTSSWSESAEILTEGQAASFLEGMKKIPDAMIDAGWEKFNQIEDVKLLQTYIQKVQTSFNDISKKLYGQTGSLVQYQSGTVTVNFWSGNTASLTEADRERIKELYYQISTIDDVKTESKKAIQSYLLSGATDIEKKILESDFAKQAQSIIPESVKEKVSTIEIPKNIPSTTQIKEKAVTTTKEVTEKTVEMSQDVKEKAEEIAKNLFNSLPQ